MNEDQKLKHELLHKAAKLFDGSHSMDDSAMRLVDALLRISATGVKPVRILSVEEVAALNVEKDVEINDYLREMGVEMNDPELRAQIRRNHDCDEGGES